MADAQNVFPVTAVESPDTGEEIPCYFLTKNRKPCRNCRPVLGFSGCTAAGVGEKAAKFPDNSLLNREFRRMPVAADCQHHHSVWPVRPFCTHPPLLPQFRGYSAVTGSGRTDFRPSTGLSGREFSVPDCVRPDRPLLGCIKAEHMALFLPDGGDGFADQLLLAQAVRLLADENGCHNVGCHKS